ncbi:MAG: zf-HC2 domain-containing protein [Candidatus Binataceae bacterium]|jgi:anti-sigma factor RsiW
MARCEDIEFLLGPFEDGELEPHEMQEVARHTAVCADCEAVLADYRSMAVALRGAQPIPDLDGFASSVLARIERMHLPPPVPRRHWYDAVSEWFANAILTGGAVAAVAIVTAILVTPEINSFLGRGPHVHAAQPATLAAVAPPVQPVQQPASLANTAVAQNNGGPPTNAGGEADNGSVDSANAGTGDDSGTVISSLESDSPSVAVWTEPETKTTVVWLPDQQP